MGVKPQLKRDRTSSALESDLEPFYRNSGFDLRAEMR
jgi:hypothetical protein